MNGTIIPNTPIAVDFWKLRECPHARLFFLTHLHGDHIAGLTPTWNYPIYCSEVTARLLSHHHQIKDDLLHTLTLDTPHIIYLDREHTEQMTVTLFDANHCPGAVMFLFEGYFGRILHTGDFRFQLSMISEESTLKEYKGKIDVMYLDNTYCSPMCCFPTRTEATDTIIDIIQTHPEHDIVLGLRSLGKETLLYKIAMTLKEWISVPSKFYESLQLLNAPDVFQNNDSSCRIRVEPFHKISNKFIEKLNAKHKTVAILPTAIYCGIDARPFENNDNVYVVPYSDHSSYTELMQFVSFLKPCKIIPVVSGSARGPFGHNVSDRANMSRFDKYLNVTATAATQPVPDTVLRFMKGRALVPLENVTVKQGVKRRKRLMSATVGVKKVKKGVVFEDSPEKAAEIDQLPLTNKNELSGKTLDKENVDLTSTANIETSDTEQRSLNEVQTDTQSQEEEVCDSELELPESQGFEYNSDSEEKSFKKNKEALEFKSESKVNLEILGEEIRLSKLQKITSMGNKSSELNSKQEDIDSSELSDFSFQETQESPVTANRRKLVKGSLEFVLLGRKKRATRSACCKKSYEDTEKNISEDGMYETDTNLSIDNDLDDLVVDVEDDSTSNNYNSALSTLGEETVWKTASEVDETDSLANDNESQSLLSEQTKKKPDRWNIDSATSSSDKRSKVNETCSDQLKLDKGSEDASKCVSAEESLIVLDGVSHDLNYSVITIKSDSEHTQPTYTQTTELSSNVPEAVAEMFNDTLSTVLSENEPKSIDEMFSNMDDSLPGSDTHSTVHSDKEQESKDELYNVMDNSLPQSENDGKQTINYEDSRNVAPDDDKSEADKQNTLDNKGQENSKLALKNVSVIKWEPNFTKLRKQRFHQTLTKFANGMKM